MATVSCSAGELLHEKFNFARDALFVLLLTSKFTQVTSERKRSV